MRSPVAFVIDQMAIMDPMTALLWVGGTAWLLSGSDRGRYGVFGWAFLVVLGSFIVLKGKNYYVTPAYPIVFAAGAVALDVYTDRGRRRWIRSTYAALLAVSGLVLMPLAVPILPPETLLRYERGLGFGPPAFEHQNNGPLPQYFADEFGWEDLVREVARVYRALPPADRQRATIFSNGWGEAAALDFFGPRYGLPRAISAHNSYWLWGPGDCTGEVMIILRTDGTGDRRHFATVEKAGHVGHPYARRDEWFDIFVCRGLNFDLQKAWPRMKAFD